MSPSNLEEKFQTLHEIVRAARLNLAPGPWDYLAGGAETETTLRRNRIALDSLAFRPRVLRNVSKIDTTSSLFGRPIRIPVMIAPVGSVESFEAGGGATAAKASAEFNVPQMLSSVCNPGLEAGVADRAEHLRHVELRGGLCRRGAAARLEALHGADGRDHDRDPDRPSEQARGRVDLRHVSQDARPEGERVERDAVASQRGLG